MKFKVTNNQLKNWGAIVVRAPYCSLVHLLKGIPPIAYNRGIYGWNYDLYQVGCIFVCTGYRNLYGENLPDVLEKYEELAKSLSDTDKIGELRQQFIRDVCSEWAKHNTQFL